ncbi:hypothetical protein GCM10023321_12930 [Pseudonocardia eucalypti]|uniref:Iminophenyl-pyruvate dimer synthase domain-containing protein n=1 Tax=Pseudonocardia eucalypti TaxID=648755 RepID=A0ABP9PN32_9PSEU|nr:hypothetical protein [Pseudonocardia eucalypti]
MDTRFFTPGSITPVPSRGRDGASNASVAPEAGPSGSLHDPPLEPRDEAVFLLTAAAEIEHALMVQYLYAAYSVRVVAGPHEQQLREIRDLLTQIAREEMGHLATVQNLLHLVGGQVHLDRNRSAGATDVSPFRFALEPLSLDSLAKYVIAESPMPLPDTVSAGDAELVERIREDAVKANGGQEVRHVGRIFERLDHLFATGLADADIRPDTGGRHATFDDWGFEPRSAAAGEKLIVESFPETDPGPLRDAARKAVSKIGEQGEGSDLGPVGTESHFERFLEIYKRVSTLVDAGAQVAHPVATNPNTSPPGAGQELDPGRITHRRARAWARLFNLRYRMLLQQLAHFLLLDQPVYSSAPGPRLGDRTARGLLLVGAFDEMRYLGKIAGKLVNLPKEEPATGTHAGPPFELPYTLNLPDGEEQRWRRHLDVSLASVRLVREELPPIDAEPFLEHMVESDLRAQAVMSSLARGEGIPPENLPTGFAKVVTILEEAVRGFTIGRHGNLWAGTTRDGFLALRFFGTPPVMEDQGGVVADPDAAPLIARLSDPVPRTRMPRLRPPVPAERVSFIRQWISDGCPDNSPPGSVGVQHEPDPTP